MLRTVGIVRGAIEEAHRALADAAVEDGMGTQECEHDWKKGWHLHPEDPRYMIWGKKCKKCGILETRKKVEQSYLRTPSTEGGTPVRNG